MGNKNLTGSEYNDFLLYEFSGWFNKESAEKYIKSLEE